MQIHTCMFKAVAVLLLASLAAAQQPNCKMVTDSLVNIYFGANETQLLRLSDYITGYNLNFVASNRLTPPFYSSSVQSVPTIPEGYSPVSIDMLTNSDRAWTSRGVMLFNQGDLSKSLVLLGSLTNDYNLNFTKTIELVHQNPTICMGAVLVGVDSVVVDCQQDDGLDVAYIVDATGSQKVTLGPGIKVNGLGRKSLAFTTKDGIFVFAATLNDFVDADKKGETSISVYKIDLPARSIETLDSIDAKSLGRDTLYINDMSQDNTGNIYVASQKTGLIRFKYISNQPTSISYGSIAQDPLKISTFVNSFGQQIILQATSTSIFEIKWTSTEFTPLRVYQLPPGISAVKNLQASNFVIMLQSQDSYYFYRPGEQLAQNILFVVKDDGNVGIIDQQTPQILITGTQKSTGYIITSGLMRIDTQQGTYIIQATSQTPTGNKTCEVDLLAKSIKSQDITNVFIIKKLPQTLTVESAVIVILTIDNYFIGSRLSYQNKSPPEIASYIDFIEDFVVQGTINLHGVTFMTTYPVDQNNYYRITRAGDNTYSSEYCSYWMNQGSTHCQAAQTFRIDGSIVTYDIFDINLTDKSGPVFAYVKDTSPNTLQLQPLGDLPQPQPVPIATAIAHVKANSLYLFITIRQNPQIQIYSLKTNELVNNVSANSFTSQQLADIVRFKPRSVVTSQSNPSLLFIKNLQSVIIMKITSNSLLFLSNVKVFQTADITTQWEIAVSGRRMLIIIKGNGQKDQVLEYALEDLFSPVFLKDLNALGDSFADPLQVFQTNNSQIVFIKTNTAVASYKMNVPLVQSNYFLFENVDSSSIFSVVAHAFGLIIQTASKDVVNTKRLYYHPQFIVSAYIPDTTFKKSFNYGLTINGQGNSSQLTGQIVLYNFITRIEERNIKNDEIPLNETADKIWVEINIDSMFNGSITHTELDCPYCKQSKITLIDHVSPYTKIPSLPSQSTKIINLKSLSLVLALTSKSVHTFFYNGTLANQLILLWPCRNAIQYINSIIIMICQNQTSQFFVPIDISNLTMQQPIAISDDYKIYNPSKILLTDNLDQLLVLDNTVRGDGLGNVKVFTVATTDDGYDIQSKTILDYNSFGYKYQTPVMSITKLNTQKSNNSTLILVTLADIGLGYIAYTASGWQQGKFIDLSAEQKIQNYVLENNKFLQVIALNNQKNTDTLVKNYVAVVVSNGDHLQLLLTFSRSADTTFLFNTFEIINSFNKYGRQTVLNEAQFQPLTNINTMLGWLTVLYFNETTNSVTNAIYTVPVAASSIPYHFKASSSQKVNLSANPATIPFAYFASGNEVRLVTPSSSDNSLSISNISAKCYLYLNYDKPDTNCTEIKIKVSNDFSSADHTVPVKFASSDDDNPLGISWYIWLIVGVGGLFVLGLIYGISRFARRRIQERKKISLLTEAQQV